MIRALVVDDSATARAAVTAILTRDVGVAVVGEARDGVEAVELAARLRPDIVTMDILMPRLNGLEATKEIMIEAPCPILLVTGGLDPSESALTMQALESGAVCVLAKPPAPGSPAYERHAIQLVETVKAMAGVKVVHHRRTAAHGARLAARKAAPRVIAIAASTGGPAALARLVADLPADFPTPLLVVQHMTPGFTTSFAGWLRSASALAIRVAEAGESLMPGTLYLAPEGRHLQVAPGPKAVLSSGLPVAGFRPSGSVLFDSVAEVYGAAATAVVLTGMGEDGIAGLRTLRRAGGRVLAQDRESCVVFGMPAAAIAAGLVDEVVSLGALGGRLRALTGNGHGGRQ